MREGGREGGGGGGGGPDTELKTKTPHVNVGNKLGFHASGRNPFARNEVRSPKTAK